MPTLNITRSVFDAIGTKWDVQIHELITPKDWASLSHQLHARIEQFDKAYSRFRADTLVSQIAQQAGTYKLPPDGYKLLHFYEKLYTLTAGKVTPLIGQTLADAGYDAAYSLQPKLLTAPVPWEKVISYDTRRITVTQPILLDFGAAGKGYLVDILAELIEAAGIKSYLINAGGDIRQRSTDNEAVQVGLENPFDTSEAVGTLALNNASLCASSGSKRQWAGYNHIIDPTALKSPERVVATWVMAEDTLTADGLATALFFTSPKQLVGSFTFAYALLTKDGQLTYSKNFPVQLFGTA